MPIVSYRALAALGLASVLGAPAYAVSAEAPIADLIAIDDAYSPAETATTPDTFAQLSLQDDARKAHAPSANKPATPASPDQDDPNAFWLSLSGLAAMAFIARRHHKVSSPVSRLPASA